MKKLILILLLMSLSAWSAPQKPSNQKILVRPGQTIYSLLKKHKFTKKQISEVLKKQSLFSKEYTLFPKKPYWVEKNNNTVSLIFIHPKKDETLEIWKTKTAAGIKKEDENYEIKVKTVNGKIRGSLVASISKHVKDQELPYRFMDAYKLDYNLRKQVQRNAKFSMSYEEKYLNGQFIKFGEVLKTELVLKNKNQTRYFLKHKDGGSFVATNELQKKRPLYAPVDYLRITSDFKPRRFHPIRKRFRAHLGIDFELPTGSNIYSSADGKVLRIGRNRGAGKFVVVKHKNGLVSYYNHLNDFKKGLKKGQSVSAGELIGFIGCTGLCTKPHLHYAVKKHGRYVNPAKLITNFPYNKKQIIKQRLSKIKSTYSEVL